MIIRDKVTQTSRGFGFITFENPTDAEEAIKAMNSKVSTILTELIFTEIQVKINEEKSVKC